MGPYFFIRPAWIYLPILKLHTFSTQPSIMRLFFSTSVLLLSLSGRAQHFYLFIGTYTQGGNNQPNGSKGIYVYDFDAATGDMKPLGTADAENPSYLAVAPAGD